MAEEPTPGLGRGARILLYASLAVNLIVVGLVVGSLFVAGDRREDRRPPRAGETGLGPIMLALSPEDRRQLGREMRRTLRQERGTLGEMRAANRQVVSALRAEPFEIAAVDALLLEQFSEAEFRLDLARRIFLNRVAAMSDAERTAFAARLEAHLERPRPPNRALD